MDLGVGGALEPDRGGVLNEVPDRSDRAAWIAATFDHRPRDPALFERALTHASRDTGASYERLEFLGDRVLGLSMAEWLYELFPDEPEGLLSRRINTLVSGATCAEVARAIGVADQMRLGKGAKATVKDGDGVLGDVIESLLGALYLEAGLDAARAWVRRHWAPRVHGSEAARQHPKAELQDWALARNLGLPAYTLLGETGPDHQPCHTVSVRVGAETREATAATKREAETEAARVLVAALKAAAPAKKRKPAGKPPRAILAARSAK